MSDSAITAVRATLAPTGELPPDASPVRELALRRGIHGWVRGDAVDDAPLALHAEGPTADLSALLEDLDGLGALASEPVPVEGHEQFAVRGVSAGAFVVQEHQASAHHYDLRLELDGVMRSWAVPKGPSLDPAVKRLAVQVADHGLAHNSFEGRAGDGGVIVWDRGDYEQGGRVAWPEALTRGHAVFVLRGEKLSGGWALQRTGADHGERTRWLLIKRRDAAARPGSEVTVETPASVLSGRTLAQVLAGD